MLVTQKIREGVNVVQLHLDPERKIEPFAGLPKVTTLRSRPGSAPRIERTTLRWTGPDLLSIEIPLDGVESSLTTVDVPGQGVVSLPPVCLPYSPEFSPALPDRGLVTLERLGRTTGGMERLDLQSIWKDLPRQRRTVPIGRWFLLAAVVLWLLEVVERRTSVLSRLMARKRRQQPTEQGTEDEARPARRKLPAAPAKGMPAVGLPSVPPRTEEAPAPMPAPLVASSSERGDVLDAIRKTRQRLRGRGEG
jgi:hypothetical protein